MRLDAGSVMIFNAAGAGALLGSVVPGAGTAVGIIVGVAWGAVTFALEETKDENGISYMEHIDNAAYDIFVTSGNAYVNGYTY